MRLGARLGGSRSTRAPRRARRSPSLHTNQRNRGRCLAAAPPLEDLRRNPGGRPVRPVPVEPLALIRLPLGDPLRPPSQAEAFLTGGTRTTRALFHQYPRA